MKINRDTINEQVKQIRARHPRAVARALSRVEEGLWEEATRALLQRLYPFTGKAFIIGVTGGAGTGKSTLVDHLAQYYRQEKKKVAIIAVDPTSPFSGGAVLGDRIRMKSLSDDPGVFIRSMATRGQLGGLAPAIHEALLILDAAGYEILIVETVGVGQDEVDIVKAANVTLVLLVPGMGDDVQTIKAGIMEIGDVFVINKADRDGVLRTEQELKSLLSMASRPDSWQPPVVKTVATRGEGVQELARAVKAYRRFLTDTHRGAEARQLFRDRIIEVLRERLAVSLLRRIPRETLNDYADKVQKREMDPYTAVDRLLAEVGLKE